MQVWYFACRVEARRAKPGVSCFACRVVLSRRSLKSEVGSSKGAKPGVLRFVSCVLYLVSVFSFWCLVFCVWFLVLSVWCIVFGNYIQPANGMPTPTSDTRHPASVIRHPSSVLGHPVSILIPSFHFQGSRDLCRI